MKLRVINSEKLQVVELIIIKCTILKLGSLYYDVHTNKTICINRFEVDTKITIFQHLQLIAIIT